MMLRRLRITLFTAALLLLPALCFAPANASAVNVFKACDKGAAATDVCQSVDPGKPGENPFIKIIRVVIIVLSIIIGIASVIIIITGGLAMITAGGDTQSIAKARGMIFNALIGLIIASLAPFLVGFVLNKIYLSKLCIC